MENKKNELTYATPENENEITAVENEELEFLPVDAEEISVTDERTETEPSPEVSANETEAEIADDEAKNESEAVAETSDDPETTEDEPLKDESDSEEKQNSPGYLLKLVGVLTAICMCIALLLAVVNSITADRIAENIANQKQKAILAIFPDGTDTREYINDNGDTAYIVYRDGEPIGYCVNTSGSGFGGNVEVMVGLTPTGEVYGVEIVSMSETPGIGTKVQSESFLGQFIGQQGSADADIISGATFSSNAVKEAVDKALAVEIDIYEITQNENAARSARMMQ